MKGKEEIDDRNGKECQDTYNYIHRSYPSFEGTVLE